ncbi:MAG TPA: hypothetical protein VFF65_02545 [Phycisphaerales bacterium]|nr:hypothetical protein [Phycisphaerales bacterium]
MKKTLALLTAAALLTTLAGCYKSDWEKEKSRADSLQTEVDKAREELKKATAAAQTAADNMNRLRTGTSLVSIVDGKRFEDGIALTNDGFFVKNGLRVRGANSVRYTMGALTDGPIALKREKYPDKPYVQGFVKNNRADGEWTWYDTTGKLVNRQIFANGKQVSVEAATVARDGKVTYRKLDKAAADKFFDARKDVFINIPEFYWER